MEYHLLPTVHLMSSTTQSGSGSCNNERENYVLSYVIGFSLSAQ